MLRAKRIEVIMELIFAPKEPRVLCVKAEHEADDQFIEVLEILRRRLFAIAREQGAIDFSHERTGLAREVELALDVGASHVHHELQTIIFFAEVLEFDPLRLVVRTLHVVDLERLEIARHDPARALGVRQRRRIALCLLERLQQRAVALLDRRIQVFSETLLLDHRVRRRDHHVDVAHMTELHALLKAHKARRILDAVDLLQELDPKPLAVLLLITNARPFLREVSGGFRLGNHGDAPPFFIHMVFLNL